MSKLRTITFLPIVLIILLCKVESSKILVIYPMPTHSHFTLGVTLANGLANKGHEVTMINPYPDKTSPKIRDISTENIIPFVKEGQKQLMEMGQKDMIREMLIVQQVGTNMTRMVFENLEVKKLMHSNEHFDLIIIEHFMNEALIGLGYHFKAPVILVASIDATLGGNIFANPAPSSYVPNKFGTLTPRMNFWERLNNFISNVLFDIVRENVLLQSQKKLFEEFVTKDIPFESVLYNVSLMFTNSHISVTNPNPHQVNIIEIGGFHVTPPKKLPDNLQKFMDNAKEGVVLFSMGSNLKSADLKPETRDAILKAFSKIKQQVLWKFEADIDNLPENVKIMKWLPQNDILAHPNTHAFVSHGGLLGTIETIYHGVPVIGIPVFGDQKSNIAGAVANGYALTVPLNELNEDNLLNALDEILNNPKYRQTAKRRSRLMHDRPLKPIDTAVYWAEYIIRHQGAPELRSPAIDLKLYQLYMIDIILFLCTITCTVSVIFLCVIRKLSRFFLCRKSNQMKSKRE